MTMKLVSVDFAKKCRSVKRNDCLIDSYVHFEVHDLEPIYSLIIKIRHATNIFVVSELNLLLNKHLNGQER